MSEQSPQSRVSASETSARAITAGDILARGFECHRAGNLDEAERCYVAILRIEPRNFDALHLLGVAATQRGQLDQAIKLLASALAIDPRSIQAYVSLGKALKAQRRLLEALASYDQALALSPDLVEVLTDRGSLLFDLGRFDEALASFDRALAIDGQWTAALYNRGVVLQATKRHDAAIAAYDDALAFDPTLVAALNNRASALAELGRLDEAVECWTRALSIQPDLAEALSNRTAALQLLRRHGGATESVNAVSPRVGEDSPLDRLELERALGNFDDILATRPDFADAWSNRATTLKSLHRYDEALASVDKALGIKPDFPDARANRASVLIALGRCAEALENCQAALNIDADHPVALANRGAALSGLGRVTEALESYDRALEIKPDFVDAMLNRGAAHAALGRHEHATTDFERAIIEQPENSYAKAMLLHSRMHLCDWREHTLETRRMLADVESGNHTTPPFVCMAASASAIDQLLCARAFVADRLPAAATPLWSETRYQHDRVRVAYLSTDLHDHPVAALIAGVVEAHDRKRFETVALSLGTSAQDAMRTRLRNAFDRFIDVSERGDHETAQLIRDLEIDIAVDLTGHTQGARTGILAWRAAPIQVNFLGYPGTMGADYIDYIVADREVIPTDRFNHYTENVVHLPETFQPNDSKRVIATQTPSREELGLPENAFVFCCFNQSFKINPIMFDVWMRLLNRVDGSVLWLLGGNASVRFNLQQEAEVRGVSARRLVFASRLGYAEHLARLRRADLFLDTLPFNAGATASDALWAGLPLITCSGDAFSARMARSLLKAVGLSELVTGSLADYETLALKLAKDTPALSAFRQRLARSRDAAPLFDTARYCRHLEAAYLEMWSRQQRGLPTSPIVVDTLAQ